jgi:hypothetical protein
VLGQLEYVPWPLGADSTPPKATSAIQRSKGVPSRLLSVYPVQDNPMNDGPMRSAQLLASRPAPMTRVTAITTLRRTPAPNDNTEVSDIDAR